MGKKRAVVIGATGLVGSELLPLLLNSDTYEQVFVLGRRSTGVSHPKLEERLGDLLAEDFFEQEIQAQDWFCCIGTTQAKTPDLTTYKQIDYGIPVRAAECGLKNEMQQFLVISSLGANANSKMFYSRVKGQMEEALKKMSLPQLRIFRPSLLMGKRNEKRFGERLALLMNSIFGFAIPKKYKGVEASKVARAMFKAAQEQNEQVLIESDQILAV